MYFETLAKAAKNKYYSNNIIFSEFSQDPNNMKFKYIVYDKRSILNLFQRSGTKKCTQKENEFYYNCNEI